MISEVSESEAGLCKDCEHWSALITFPEEPLYYKGVCVLATSGHPGFRARPMDGLHARLETNRDFGCNQFEAKP